MVTKTIFFFHSGVVLCQGEYIKHYKEFVFPQIISQLSKSSEDLNPQTPKASGNSYESNSTTPKTFSPTTPIAHGDENLRNIIRIIRKHQQLPRPYLIRGKGEQVGKIAAGGDRQSK